MAESHRRDPEKQLGLRLEKTKAPVDALVVDHTDKIPIGRNGYASNAAIWSGSLGTTMD